MAKKIMSDKMPISSTITTRMISKGGNPFSFRKEPFETRKNNLSIRIIKKQHYRIKRNRYPRRGELVFLFRKEIV
jgi:hypothetical protein